MSKAVRWWFVRFIALDMRRMEFCLHLRVRREVDILQTMSIIMICIL